MNWEAAGAIGEIVGALAVVISLVYLASQIRIQNREARAAATHDILASFREVQSKGLDLGLSEVIGKATHQGFDSLTAPEQHRVILYCVPFLRVWEEAYHQHKAGRLDVEMWDSINTYNAFFMESALHMTIWSLRGNLFTISFRAHVDEIIEASSSKLNTLSN